VLPL
jgi:hypothetical protein